MTTRQTPDAVREAAEEIVALPHGLDIGYAQDIARRILAALDSRAGDAGEGFGAVLERWDSVIPLSHDERAKLIAELTAATPAPAADAVPAGEGDALRVDWNRRELADAYDMVEGLRQQIAQPVESPLNQSLIAVMDALEAADVEWSGITKPNRSGEA